MTNDYGAVVYKPEVLEAIIENLLPVLQRANKELVIEWEQWDNEATAEINKLKESADIDLL